MGTILRGMTWDHPRGLDSLMNSNSVLEQDVAATVLWEARSLLAFGDQPIVEFYKNFDLMVIDHPHVPDAVHDGTIVSLESLLSEEKLERLQLTSVGQSHLSYKYQGKQWALAIDTAAQVSAFRPDKADHSPIYWSEVFDLAKSGSVLWPHKPVDAFSTFASLMAQREAPLASTESFINKDIARSVLQFMVELSALVPAQCLTSNPIDVAELLAADDRYSHAVCMYGYSNYSRKGFRENIICYDDLPSFDGQARGSQLGGAGIAVSSASKNPQLAAEVAFLLSSPEVQSDTYVVGGGQPGNLVAWKSGFANEITGNFFANTLRSLERAWVRPRIYGWPEVQYASSQIIYKILTEKKLVEADLEAIEDCYEAHIKEVL